MIYFFKALHVVGFVSWFAGLFYLVRMFVYHAEAQKRPEPEKTLFSQQFHLMEVRVYRIICQPAFWITWIAGSGMLTFDLSGIDRRAYFESGTPYWLWVKLALLLGLSAYHFWCQRVITTMEKGSFPFNDWQFRLLNEFPTLFLVAIAFITVYGKAGTLNYGYLLLGIVGFVGLLYLGAKAYRMARGEGGNRK